MKIKYKLISGYLVVVLLAGALAFVGISVTRNVQDLFSDIADHTLLEIRALEELRASGLRIIISTSEFGWIKAERRFMEASGASPEELGVKDENEDKSIENDKDFYGSALHKYEELMASQLEEKNLLERIRSMGQQLIERSAELVEMKKKGISGSEVLKNKERFKESGKNFLEIIDQTLLYEDGEIRGGVRNVATAISLASKTILVGLFALGLMALLISGVSARPISQSIEKLRDLALQISKGNLQQKIHVRQKDEIGDLANAFNQMSQNLQKTTISRDSLQAEVEKQSKILLQTEKMVAVGQLAGGVAHEINNPLGVILGFSQSLVKRLSPSDPLAMPLLSIEREAIRCKKLVQDLLAFSRKGGLEKEEIDLNQTIEGALSLVLAQTKVKNIEFIKELEPDLAKIIANSNRLQQVIINLCNNAMDAMPNGGTLTVRSKKSQLNNKDAVQIQVQDTGQGIPKEIQNRIFDPFFTTKEIGKGTGLGLSLVFETIQQHNGQIKVDSEVGKGTVFYIQLPMA